MKPGGIYLPGLNGVRFIAALMVIIAHLERFKQKAELPNVFDNAIISKLGSQGVGIFFVLSGFLITYLLLREKEKFGRIDIKKFYIRRILRIWPLYYLILILGFFVLPYLFSPEYFTPIHPDIGTKLFLGSFLLSNVLFLVFGHIFMIGPLWSVGTEEQYYLVWPTLINKVSSKHILRSLLLITAGIVFIKVCASIVYFRPDLFSNLAIEFRYFKKAGWLITKFLKFDMMLIGCW